MEGQAGSPHYHKIIAAPILPILPSPRSPILRGARLGHTGLELPSEWCADGRQLESSIVAPCTNIYIPPRALTPAAPSVSSPRP